MKTKNYIIILHFTRRIRVDNTKLIENYKIILNFRRRILVDITKLIENLITFQYVKLITDRNPKCIELIAVKTVFKYKFLKSYLSGQKFFVNLYYIEKITKTKIVLFKISGCHIL